MKQALHIFRKDVRRLWRHIAAVMLAIACFAALDARTVAGGENGSGIIEFVVCAAVWLLIARAVHEEALPGENQFWLTRPYERGSLLASKIMMAVFTVAVPLFVADCAILSMQSLPLGGNLGGLLLRQLVRAAWLILPPLAIASITRTITECVLVWLVALAIAGLGYFPGTTVPDFRAVNEKYALIVALVLMPCALWRQYFRRGTRGSRAMIAAAVLLPVLPFPEPAAVAIEGIWNDPAAAGITLTPKVQSISVPPPTVQRTSRCASIPVSVSGMQPGWRLAVLSWKDTFAAGGNTWSMSWWPAGGGERTRNLDFVKSGAAGAIDACLSSAALQESGAGGPFTADVSVTLAVMAEDPPIRITAGVQPFDVPGIGRCRFQYSPGTDKYALGCTAPVWFPKEGLVGIGPMDSWKIEISLFRYPWMPMNLLPGMSPVYKWVTMPMDIQIRDAIANGGQIEFSPERQIAMIRREVEVKEGRFLGAE